MKSQFAKSSQRSRRKHLNLAIDQLLGRINFKSKAEAIQPANVEITKQAFFDFYKEMDWPLPQWGFEDTLNDSIGEFQYRADNETPNWYHQSRQILYRLAKVRTGVIKEEHFEPYGGVQVAITVDYDHDRWEDLGKSALSIYSSREKRIHEWWDQNNGQKTDAEFFMLRQLAAMASDYMDLMTRKIPRMDADGNYVRKDNGKFIKDDRFGGDLNLYMDQVLKTPITIDGKYNDGIEGMSTRHIDIFTDELNRGYAEERRKIYGRRNIEQEAIERFPFMKDAIRSSDDLLGILLMITETVVDYSKPENNPRHARPINVQGYFSSLLKWVNILGPAWHPVTIALEDLENKAAKEEKLHTGLILANALYPVLLPHFPSPHNYVDRGYGTILLPNKAVYAPNMK